MARYRDVPWSLFPRTLNTGKHVWYYYWCEEGSRRGPRSTGIGYTAKKDRGASRKQANEYCAALFQANLLAKPRTSPTLDQWVQAVHFFEWDRSQWIKGIIARSPKGKLKITEDYVRRSASIYADRIKPYHGDTPIDKISPRDCEYLLLTAWKETKLKHKTINNWRSVYSTILQEAARMEIINRNPWDVVPQLAIDPEKRGGLTVAEGASILSNPPTEDPGATYYLATRTAMLTGLRLSEVAGLVGGDVRSKETSAGTVYYIDCSLQWSAPLKRRVPVKDKETRAVPISKRLYDALRSRVTADHEFVFSLRKHNEYPISIHRLGSWFNARVEAAGIDRTGRNISFHSTRRFFNTLLRRRVSGDVLRKMTGHNSEEMTEHYTDYLPEDLTAVVKAQDEFE